jgi:hypothetical protein
MPSKKLYHEIRSPRTEKLGRDSAVGGTVIADTVSDGFRTLVVKMPVVTKEGSMVTKKKSHKKSGSGKAGLVTPPSATPPQPTKVEKVETVKDSPTSFDTSKLVDEVK